jgi:hypothetical protein
MSSTRRLLTTLGLIILGVVLATLMGCAKEVKEEPDTSVAVVPQPIVITEIRYRDLPDELLVDCPIAEGAVHEIGEVARARKKSLEDCNADKASLRALRGTKPAD